VTELITASFTDIVFTSLVPRPPHPTFVSKRQKLGVEAWERG